MQKFIAILIAAMFAGSTLNAVAAEKGKADEKKAAEKKAEPAKKAAEPAKKAEGKKDDKAKK